MTSTSPSTKTGQAFDWAVLRRLLSYVRPYRRVFIGLVVLTVSAAVLGTLRSFLIQRMVDVSIEQGDMKSLNTMFMLLLVLLVAHAGVSYLQTYYGGWLGQLKHHLSTKRQAVLSNRSTDWWKTLRVWGDLLQQQQWDPLRTRLALITTATAAPGSIPSLLRDDAVRDPAEALKQLIVVAATAPSQALAVPVQVFNALTALQ
ncbi:ABC transporter transmembrane domain-containing protein [Hymenobacter siberiensis]|uniref:ABC transporter transmembrane domain-containing protein n=1 Tax=Hymenobacter siberiensis TaxID=2848396 RepID=UPI001C1DDB28|nr:ABC transporter transmembrane domain-containing protein [Hymenobacter siberiensis]